MAKSKRIATKEVAMELRADFARREVVLPGGEAWRPSPMAGAERTMLDRIGEEVARETSIVRYAAGARFSAHTHGGGEESLVLAGSFRDDGSDYPEGTYVRNPIGTAHASWAGPDGAVLFVKLDQFAAADTQRVVIDTRAARWHQGMVPGLTVLPLHEHGPESRWCGGRRRPGSGGITTGAARRSSCWMVCSRTSTARTPRAAGCAARTCRSTTRSPGLTAR